MTNPNLVVTKVGVYGETQSTGLTIGGKGTLLPIDGTKWYLAPPSAYPNRNNIVIQNQSTNGGIMLWNYDPTAPLNVGFQIPQGASRSLAIQGSIPVYVTMLTGGSTNAYIEELA